MEIERINSFLLGAFILFNLFDFTTTVIGLGLKIGLTEANEYTGWSVNYFGTNLGLALITLGKLILIMLVYVSFNWGTEKIKITIQNKGAPTKVIKRINLFLKLGLAWLIFSNAFGHFFASLNNLILILYKIG